LREKREREGKKKGGSKAQAISVNYILGNFLEKWCKL